MNPCNNPNPESWTPISPLQISLINAPAYLHAAHLPGSEVFQLSLTREGTYRKAVHHNTLPTMDLSNVPEEYHEFADVFSKQKADTLPPHQSYDLKIELEDSASPPPGCMYSLSPSELEALRIFVDEHLSNGFICPSKSPQCSQSTDTLYQKEEQRITALC